MRTLTTIPKYAGDKVRIVEVGPRDGLQNEKVSVSVETKIELVERLAKAGLKHIEAGSFVSPKWVPQMAATSEIMSHIESIRAKGTSDHDGIMYSYLVPNKKGLENFLATTPTAARGSNEISVFASATEAFSQKNLNCSIAECLDRLSIVVRQALDHGYQARGYVSMAITCPYAGKVEPSQVADVTEKLLAMGCYEVSLGDTNGTGTPGTVDKLYRHLVVERGIPVERLAAHFHDTFGQAGVNSLVALEYGVRTFDSSVGGLGGCPYSKGATGNVATEDLIYFLEGTGVSTGVDLEQCVEIGEWISKKLGKDNASRAGKAVIGSRA